MSKRKLLLADDSVTIQKVVNLTFADEGIEVITTGDGNSAMEKLREIQPDLVMADVNMPGLDGYQLCEQIKLNEATRATPVILLVGSFEPFDEEKAQAVGADDYLTKPFQSIRQLVTKVTELLAIEAPTNDSTDPHADTLKMEHSSNQSEFDDGEMDDDMIQTNRLDNYSSFDMPVTNEKKNLADSSENEANAAEEETAEFTETEFEPPSDRRDYEAVEEEIIQTEKKYLENFEDSYSDDSEDSDEIVTDAEGDVLPEPTENITEADDDYFSSEMVEEIPQEVSPQPDEETGQYFEQPEQPAPEYDETNFTETVEDIPQPDSASVLELDESNLLDLPPFGVQQRETAKQETEIPLQVEEPEAEEKEEPENVGEVKDEEVKKEVARQFSSFDFPPEVIEAIADKVVEKLSEKLKE